jgi:CRP/FNR family cyclic AMP-dependent transcriptional regulator
MTLNDCLGWLAASLVFATFSAREMVSLRPLAIASNIAFIGYGYLDHLWPILILHLAMLPVNAIRLRQALLAAGNSERGQKGDATAITSTLLPLTAFRVARSHVASRELSGVER